MITFLGALPTLWCPRKSVVSILGLGTIELSHQWAGEPREGSLLLSACSNKNPPAPRSSQQLFAPAAQLAFRHGCSCHSCTQNSAQCAGIAIDVSQHERTYSFLKGQVSEGSAEIPGIKRLKVWYNHQMSCGRGNPLILGSRLMKGCAQVLVVWGFLILPFLCCLASNKIQL